MKKEEKEFLNRFPIKYDPHPIKLDEYDFPRTKTKKGEKNGKNQSRAISSN